MADFGYDVSRLLRHPSALRRCDDFDRLLQEAITAASKVILDFVPNHTSDQHPWFRIAALHEQVAKRDWYI